MKAAAPLLFIIALEVIAVWSGVFAYWYFR
jgi:hypothetical protein